MVYSMIIILQLRMCNINEIKNEETFFSINQNPSHKTYHIKRVKIFDFFPKSQRSSRIQRWYYNFLIQNFCGTIGTSGIATILILNHLTCLVAGFHRKLDKTFSRRFRWLSRTHRCSVGILPRVECLLPTGMSRNVWAQENSRILFVTKKFHFEWKFLSLRKMKWLDRTTLSMMWLICFKCFIPIILIIYKVPYSIHNKIFTFNRNFYESL